MVSVPEDSAHVTRTWEFCLWILYLAILPMAPLSENSAYGNSTWEFCLWQHYLRILPMATVSQNHADGNYLRILPTDNVPENSASGKCTWEFCFIVTVPENSAYGNCTWEFCLRVAWRWRRGHRWSPGTRWAPARERHCPQYRSSLSYSLVWLRTFLLACSELRHWLCDCFPRPHRLGLDLTDSSNDCLTDSLFDWCM